MSRAVHQSREFLGIGKEHYSDVTTVSPGVSRLNVAGSCSNPVWIGLQGTRSKRKFPEGDMKDDSKFVVVHERGPTASLEIDAPCRKCPACLRAREMKWFHRALAEAKHAPRVWFGTLTLRPDEHYRVLAASLLRSERREVSYDGLSQAEQFRLRCDHTAPELTKYLKRLRKQSRAKFKYLLVTEAHKSGLPHYHLLIMEQDPMVPLRHKLLTEQWKLGFSNWKLTDTSRVGYVCKYLSKSMLARVRASIDFGQIPQSLSLDNTESF